jgi:hypothetical protein
MQAVSRREGAQQLPPAERQPPSGVNLLGSSDVTALRVRGLRAASPDFGAASAGPVPRRDRLEKSLVS